VEIGLHKSVSFRGAGVAGRRSGRGRARNLKKVGLLDSFGCKESIDLKAVVEKRNGGKIFFLRGLNLLSLLTFCSGQFFIAGAALYVVGC